jgi:hypothetical protein
MLPQSRQDSHECSSCVNRRWNIVNASYYEHIFLTLQRWRHITSEWQSRWNKRQVLLNRIKVLASRYSSIKTSTSSLRVYSFDASILKQQFGGQRRALVRLFKVVFLERTRGILNEWMNGCRRQSSFVLVCCTTVLSNIFSPNNGQTSHTNEQDTISSSNAVSFRGLIVNWHDTQWQKSI